MFGLLFYGCEVVEGVYGTSFFGDNLKVDVNACCLTRSSHVGNIFALSYALSFLNVNLGTMGVSCNSSVVMLYEYTLTIAVAFVVRLYDESAVGCHKNKSLVGADVNSFMEFVASADGSP